jgi:hypothetical protein
LPVGLSNTEDLLLCDVDPAPRGRVGQLIRASGLGDFRATDARINAYVARFAELLEKGSVRWDAMLPRSPAAASLQQPLPLATEGVLRYMWESRFGSMLIEVVDGVAYVNVNASLR